MRKRRDPCRKSYQVEGAAIGQHKDVARGAPHSSAGAPGGIIHPHLSGKRIQVLMEINAVENPVDRLSEAINCQLTITAPEQAEAPETVSQELLHLIVETMPDRGKRVECDRTVLEMDPAARQVHQAEPVAGMQGVWCRDV